jgi:LmbE family N-acetylglucosaminyl deacetylase
MSTTVFSLHAHPDDTEVFCSGALALLADAGARVVIGTLSGGGMGGMGEGEQATVAKRIEEATRAAQMIDADYVCLSGRDGFMYDTMQLRLEVLEVLRRERPDIVLTHLPFDYHADHRVTSNVVEIACMLTTLANAPTPMASLERTPLLYHTAPMRMVDHLGRRPPAPDFFVDVSSVMDRKIAMLGCHETQQELMRVMHGMEDFFGEMREFARQRGREVGVEFAEAYWQHGGGGFETEPRLQSILSDYVVLGGER